MSERFFKVLFPDGTPMFEQHIGDGWAIGEVREVKNEAAEGNPLSGRGSDLIVVLKASGGAEFEVVEGEGPAPLPHSAGAPMEDLQGLGTAELRSRATALGVKVGANDDDQKVADAVMKAQHELQEDVPVATEPTLSRVGAERQVVTAGSDPDQDDQPTPRKKTAARKSTRKSSAKKSTSRKTTAKK
jgi:hypothetical protein